MNCTITVDANGTVTRNYTGDVTIQLTNANSGTGYVAPECTTGKSTHVSVAEPGALGLFVLGVFLYGVGRICRYQSG